MTTPTARFAPPSTMGIYHISPWDDAFEGHIMVAAEAETILNNKSENTSDKSLEDNSEGNQASKDNSEKIQRRLAQNREAARKSRLRKKAYVQKLETSRLKLARLQLELEQARLQGLLTCRSTASFEIYGPMNSGIAAFEVEYGNWIDEQDRKISELRNVLQLPVSEPELGMMVQNVLSHYRNLFRMKRDVARTDAFYLVHGAWKTSVERFFLWIGGFRPSTLINVVMPQLGLDEQQVVKVRTLRHSCVQAEDALSLGVEKLQQTLAQGFTYIAAGAGNYGAEMLSSLEKLESLESFVLQADHLREQTLDRMSRILTTHQAAKALLIFGEYFQRLRALNSLWCGRLKPQQPSYFPHYDIE
ncbi:transcription factor TGA4-like [Henckelia pumila]|uniref:transcription factor TGA4-like n=1 Tax=Henckelia pumila TaxID=405737 RepID=UPI003C6E42D8